MGISPMSVDRSIPRETRLPEAAVGNPNPRRFTIERSVQAGQFVVLMVNYPDCRNFEGRKVLVIEGHEPTISGRDIIDPHFSESGLKLVARFTPTEQGWQWAVQFAEGVQAKSDPILERAMSRIAERQAQHHRTQTIIEAGLCPECGGELELAQLGHWTVGMSVPSLTKRCMACRAGFVSTEHGDWIPLAKGVLDAVSVKPFTGSLFKTPRVRKARGLLRRKKAPQEARTVASNHPKLGLPKGVPLEVERAQDKRAEQAHIRKVRAEVFATSQVCAFCGETERRSGLRQAKRAHEMHEDPSRAQTRGKPLEKRFSVRICARVCQNCHGMATAHVIWPLFKDHQQRWLGDYEVVHRDGRLLARKTDAGIVLVEPVEAW